MKIEVWQVGKNTTDISQGFEKYHQRLKRYLPFEVKTIRESKKTIKADQIKSVESKTILSKLAPGDYLIIMDENGRQYSSKEFAGKISHYMVRGTKRVIFLIGGAYGFDKNVYERANEMLSLSKMTFSHQLARLIFMEQLYRAFTILNNEPYHHD